MLPDYLLDVQVKKMRKTGLTQLESTCVESVEVVADVEVRSEIVEVQSILVTLTTLGKLDEHFIPIASDGITDISL
ncbi:hypothetical protein BLNAU_24393 [Blattamonas nauphoetae]|uniref:Uncharacterized protein n=1 Tax=Blattamonas nauphoetae TaxID=2049346 RepID=A0ABQ9WN07_9EUKA|nr:hypothetical protein BLNAU_24393 [Blattamonas nauphoetae]